MHNPNGKYNAKKTEVNGEVFDSLVESKIYSLLLQMQKAGHIQEIKRQVSFELQPSYIRADKKKIRPITYKCDFIVYKGDEEFVIDVKGLILSDFKLKMKMFEFKYGKILHIVKSQKDLKNLLGWC